MAFKEGSMSLSQLQDYFGADNIGDDGSFNKAGGGADAFKDDKKMRKFFIQGLGRSSDDWDDDVSFDKDLNTAVRALYSGGGKAEAPQEKVEWDKSDELLAAEERLNSDHYHVDIMEGHASKQNLGSGSTDAQDYTLNLMSHRDQPKTAPEQQAQSYLSAHKNKIKNRVKG